MWFSTEVKRQVCLELHCTWSGFANDDLSLLLPKPFAACTVNKCIPCRVVRHMVDWQ